MKIYSSKVIEVSKVMYELERQLVCELVYQGCSLQNYSF